MTLSLVDSNQCGSTINYRLSDDFEDGNYGFGGAFNSTGMTRH